MRKAVDLVTLGNKLVMCVCVHVCSKHIYVHVEARVLLNFFSTLTLETGFPTEPAVHHQTGWLSCPRDARLPSPTHNAHLCPSTESTGAHTYLAFDLGIRMQSLVLMLEQQSLCPLVGEFGAPEM